MADILEDAGSGLDERVTAGAGAVRRVARWLSADRTLVAALAGTILLRLVAAWFAEGFWHTDEYFQIFEFAAIKVGVVDVSQAMWEFPAHMRSWLQPAMVYVPWAIGERLGLSPSVFALQTAFRFVTALLGMDVFLLQYRAYTGASPDAPRAGFVAVVGLTFVVPMLSVRFASEVVSGMLVAAAIAAIELAPRRLWIAGVLLGLAFEARFQVGFMLAGLGLHLLVVDRVGFRRFATGIVLPFFAVFLAALLLDRWGYGDWSVPPLEYVKQNVVHGAANAWGTGPWNQYWWLWRRELPVPWGRVFLVLGVVAFVRFWRSRATWACVPFIAAHLIVAHKEGRFLFPALLVSLPLVADLVLDGWRRLRPRWRLPVGALVVAPLVLVQLALSLVHALVPAHTGMVAARALIASERRLAAPVVEVGYPWLGAWGDTPYFAAVDPEPPIVRLPKTPEQASSWRPASGPWYLAVSQGKPLSIPPDCSREPLPGTYALWNALAALPPFWKAAVAPRVVQRDLYLCGVPAGVDQAAR